MHTLSDVQRYYDFFRGHPTAVDTFGAVVLLGTAGLWAMVNDLRLEQRTAAVPIAFALSAVVALRRRAPERMLLVAVAAGLAQVWFDVPINLGDFALLVIVYTVSSTGVRWASHTALVSGLAAAPIATARWPGSGYSSQWQHLVVMAFEAIPFALAWVFGDSMRTRRAYYAELEERAGRLQREREAQSRAAVAAERARIARELHDVVAHNVSVMVVQADGAAYVLQTCPDQAKQALETISATGRTALAEMRRLLGLLRTGDDGGGEYVPQPGIEQLGELMEQVRGAGLPVRFEVTGEPRPLPSSLELTAYRVVQEALTNARKHGGPRVTATVRLVYRDSELDVRIEDDGRGACQELHEGGGPDGLGHGLIGMRERVAMVSGTLDAGPRPGGGFRVRAALPIRTGP